MTAMAGAAMAAAVMLIACNKGQSENLGSGEVDAVTATGSALAVSKASDGVAGGVAGRRDFSSPPVAASATDEANAALQQKGPSGAADPLTAQIAPTMVIRNGQASIEVDKLDPAIAKIRQLAAQLGGYVGNSSVVGGHDQVRSATLELKIRAQRFDQAVNGLGNIGKVESVNATAEDVGEEFVDIAARVNNAHRLEDRLIALLATRTGKLQDVLSMERELARVREEIERYEGRLRYLKTRAAVSTLSITVHEPVPILGQSLGENPIAAAIRQAWRNFVGFIAACIASLGVLIPLGVLVIAGWLGYRKIRRRIP